MLINFRNALMASRRSPLPPGARWVEYLESTGTQWIDAGLDYFPDFDITIYVPNGERNVTIYSGANHILERLNANNPYWHLIAGDGIATTATIYGLHQLNFRSGVLTIDGHVAGTISNRTWTRNIQCRIGANAGGGSYKYRLYACKMWDANGVLVRDFRPIAIGTTGYMLDMVSGQYLQYGNAGSGEFVLGPDVN